MSHVEVDVRPADAPPAAAVIQPDRVPFVSYPYEWCFGEYKAAAAMTLEIQRRALARGMILRDATAYNVQFIGTKPIFIDSLSFAPYVEGEPWSAYRQFCTHFLAPLAVMSRVDRSLGQMMRLHADGLPLDIATSLLPFSSRLSPGLLLHLHLHGRTKADDSAPAPGAAARTQKRGVSRTAMLALVDSLSRAVRGLSWEPQRSRWSNYVNETNYTSSAQDHKQRLVEEWSALVHERATTRMVWDLGANTGIFSRIVANTAETVVAFDLDYSAVEQHFRQYGDGTNSRILPLLQDLSNPTAGAGWRGIERRSLEARGPADLALALALVHHLAITNNVPLPDIAAFFGAVCRHLIIEFIPADDSQVQRMLMLRGDTFAGYSQPAFEQAFATRFETIRSAPVQETKRTLYLMARRT